MAMKQTVMVKPQDAKSALHRLLGYVAEYKWILLACLLLSFAGNVAGLIGPSLAGSAINEAAAGVGKVNFENVRYFASRMLLCYIISSGALYCPSSFSTLFSTRPLQYGYPNLSRYPPAAPAYSNISFC